MEIQCAGLGWKITGYLLRLMSRELCIFIELGFVNLESAIDFCSTFIVEGMEYAPGPGTLVIIRITERIPLRLMSSWRDFMDADFF